MDQNNLFKGIEPILTRTENWRAKSFQKFWTAALRYSCYGDVPRFIDTEGKDVQHMTSTFNEFKSIVDKAKSPVAVSPKPTTMTPKINTPSPAPTISKPDIKERNTKYYITCSNKDYEELLDRLGDETELFTPVEKCILIDMLKHSRDRKEIFYHSPMTYTTTRVHNMGFPYANLYSLRDILKDLGIISYETKVIEGYQYPFTYYCIDEPKLLELVRIGSYNDYCLRRKKL